MTQTPPCGPENQDQLFILAQQHVQDLQQLTRDIQLHTKMPALPALSQLIFQRAEQLNALSQLNLSQLSPEKQAVILETLQQCQALDPEIEERLSLIRNRLKEQAQGLKSGQALISKYKIDNPQQTGLHSQDA